MSYVYIFFTILLTVYGQIVIKWQVRNAGIFPEAAADKVWFLLKLMVNPWVVAHCLRHCLPRSRGWPP